MKTIYQNSIFMSNELGALTKLLDIIKDANIQIIASTISDTADYGIYRVITPEPKKTYEALQNKNIPVYLTEVLAISLSNQVGSAFETLAYFVEAGVNISYMYSFFFENQGVLILRTNDMETAQEVVDKYNLICLTDTDLLKFK